MKTIKDPHRFACTECGNTYPTAAKAAQDFCARKCIAGYVDRQEDPELWKEVTK